jgi:small-conductance mechanosensitive channel
MTSVDGVLSEPPPRAFVEQFGDSSIDFALRFWHEPQTAVQWDVRDRVARQLKKDLDAAGIEIPFPQRVLQVPRGTISIQKP